MDILVTSDWQTRLDNLDNCEKVAQKILRLCTERKLQAVVIAGDLKHHYDPTSNRVTLWWMDFIARLRAKNVEPVLLLGNHDRIGLHQDEQNWLPILEAAGADTYWQFGSKSFVSSKLFIFPFVNDRDKWLEQAKELEHIPTNPKKDVLVFHQTLIGSRFNKFGTVAEKGFPLAALKPERFRFVLGGDIHLPQRIGENAWYVGSPFSQDWGECNQQKFFAIVTDKGLEWVPTGMPGWYDPDVKGFKPPKSWEGTRVRIKVPLAKGDDYSDKLSTAKNLAKQKYPGANVTVVTEILDTVKPVGYIEDNLTEIGLITKYVAQVWPNKDSNAEAVAFIEHKLKQTGLGYRSDKGVKFKRVWASNVLSFEKVELSFQNPGLCLVTGINKDWPGRSNGSGKTNLLCLLSIALFGKTIKGQSHDAWAREGYTGTSHIGLEWDTADGSIVRVERTRNPVSVRLWVNDVEMSTGGRPTDVAKDIENLCGFSWDMFVALIYISREEQSFLWGTQKQKQEMLARLQNLERFAAALKLVNNQRVDTVNVKYEWDRELASIEERIKEKEQQDEGTKEVNHFRTELKNNQAELKSLKIPEIGDLKRRLAQAETVLGEASDAVTSCTGALNHLTDRLKEMCSTPDICPTCGQKVVRNKNFLESKQVLEIKIYDKDLEVSEASRLYTEAAGNFDRAREAFNTAFAKRNLALGRKIELVKVAKTLQQNIERWEQYVIEKQNVIEQLCRQRQLLQTVKTGLEFELAFLTTVQTILSRQGLPAYLTQAQLPKINKVAEYYSKLFTEGVLQVRFYIGENEEIETEVINPSGGRCLNGQSEGEGGLEGLVTAFALRGVGVGANVLVLDEPGDGLDAANGRAFAAGMRKIGPELGTVFLITHSDAISGELADAPSLIVAKENGVSHLVNKV